MEDSKEAEIVITHLSRPHIFKDIYDLLFLILLWGCPLGEIRRVDIHILHLYLMVSGGHWKNPFPSFSRTK